MIMALPQLRRLLFLAFFAVYGLISPALFAGQISIAVANDFDFTLEELTREFERFSDHDVTIVPGPSSHHYGQIMNGAGYDIFLSDETSRTEILESENKTIPGSRFTYAFSRLVLWSVDNRPLDSEVLREKNFHLLALTNPRLSAYGRAAQETLETLSVWDSLQDKLVFGENVGQTYQFAISGDTDLALIAFSQIVYGQYMQAGSYWLIPDAWYTPIELQGVLLTENPAAREFLDYMQSDQARQIIQGNGFSVP
jgi:molybdate transport system substrate-binding protein